MFAHDPPGAKFRCITLKHMKKLIPLLVLLLGVSRATAQQGTVNFRNNQVDFPTPANREVYSFTEFIPLVGTNFQARLLYGGDASSLQPATYITPTRFRNVTTGNSLAGTWSGDTRTLTGFAPGTTLTLMVQVWDAGPDAAPGVPGRTFEQARATGALWCQSAPFTYTIPPAGTLDPQAYYMDGLRSFCFIPEPSVVAFGAIGLVALVLLKNGRTRRL